jgi:hypothetical protein
VRGELDDAARRIDGGGPGQLRRLVGGDWEAKGDQRAEDGPVLGQLGRTVLGRGAAQTGAGGTGAGDNAGVGDDGALVAVATRVEMTASS